MQQRFCVQIDDTSNKSICTDDVATKLSYERLGLRVTEETMLGCRINVSGDCPEGQTCTKRFAHASIANAIPTVCRP